MSYNEQPVHHRYKTSCCLQRNEVTNHVVNFFFWRILNPTVRSRTWRKRWWVLALASWAQRTRFLARRRRRRRTRLCCLSSRLKATRKNNNEKWADGTKLTSIDISIEYKDISWWKSNSKMYVVVANIIVPISCKDIQKIIRTYLRVRTHVSCCVVLWKTGFGNVMAIKRKKSNVCLEYIFILLSLF